MVRRLAASKEVHDCVSNKYFEYAYARAELPGDQCSVAKVQSRFWDTGGDLKDLVRAVIVQDSFLYRKK